MLSRSGVGAQGAEGTVTGWEVREAFSEDVIFSCDSKEG